MKRLDLDAESRRALELDAVLEAVAAHAATARGRELLRALEPIAESEAIASEHRAIEETRRQIVLDGRLLPGRLPDPAAAMAALAVDGYGVDALPLRDLASVLLEAAALRGRLAGLDPEEFPALAALGRAIPDLRTVAAPVAEHVEPDGTIGDGASAELHRIRVASGRTGERLRRQLLAYLHDPESQPVIRDSFVTQRNGRYVIPVRSDAPRAVKGIVHAASSSGATLFVEPMESIELNNEIVRLAEAEAAERERVLDRWASGFRGRWDDVVAAVESLVRADTLQARALFGDESGAVSPTVVPRGALRLRAVRHPLLDRRLRERGDRCTPLDFTIDPYDRVLVLSGPNAGGKTVALKTLGLAVLLAQAGVPVPAASAELPLFGQFRADIGDHQSIDADLSTFSAHVRAVARYFEEVEPPALLLFDEIGTGTEPTEGAALAQATLERLQAAGATVVATTHQTALKSWAFTDPGAESAAMEFDTATLRPTFRILPKAAGISAGIEIASRLGLDEAIVDRARELLGPDTRQAEAAMARIRERTAEIESRLEAIRRNEEDLDRRLREFEARAVGEAERRRDTARRALDEALREFREASRRELESIQEVKERARVEREQFRAASRLAAEAQARVRRLSGTPVEPARRGPVEPAPGVPVHIRSLGRDGVVVAVRGEKIEVRMGAATFTVRRDDLAAGEIEEAAPRGAGGAKARPSKVAALLGRRAPPDTPDDGSVPAGAELHLIGKRVDEALPELDKYLDEAALAGRVEVRIVHGHGTGALRRAVREFLRAHPHVDTIRSGEPNEGGDGATVVRLR